MRAILLRHYKTLTNVNGQIMGWGNSPPAKDWEPDLRYVDQRLRGLGLEFDAVYTSRLERSMQTGQYFAQARDIDEIRDMAEFNEVNYGALYKKSKKWVEAHIPQYKTDPDFVFPGGESFRAMQKRSVDLLLHLAEELRDQTILIIAHAGVIRGLISHFMRLDYAACLKHKISHRYIGDFQFRETFCRRYDELGKPSGFVTNRVLRVPCHCVQAGAGEQLAAEPAPQAPA